MMDTTSPLRREIAAGAVAGLIGGAVFALAMQERGLTADVTGLLGLSSSAGGLSLHLLLGALAGAGFGAIFRYQPHSYATTMTSGVVYGLIVWIIGPLTLRPILDGVSPTWSADDAVAAFPSLIGHLMFGGLTGLVFHLLATLDRSRRPAAEGQPVEAPPPRRVVILGGGFGGLGTAQRLEQLYRRDPSLEITLVSKSDYLLFTPMLAEVAAGGLEAQHISAPVRAACPRTECRHAEVDSIDAGAKVVRLRTRGSVRAAALPYDHLVLALGAVPNFYGLPGLQEHALTLKTLEDATRLRNHVIAALEQADAERDDAERRRLLTFVVAGGGFAGTETIAELFDLARSARRYYTHVQRNDLRFVLIHSGDRILPELSPELGTYALDKLRVRGIEFLLGRRVAGATATAVLLDDGSEVPTRTLVWTAGNQPNPLLQTLPCERSRGGQVVVDGTLRVQGLNDVWAVGDCAQIPDPDSEGRFYPPTAQHALREGRVVAENISAGFAGKAFQEFRFRTVGTLVALGHRTAVAEIRGRRFSGQLAWLMWRATYLSKLPGMEQKVRVALDWALDLVFPRDIVLTANVSSPEAAEPAGSIRAPESTEAPVDHEPQ